MKTKIPWHRFSAWAQPQPDQRVGASVAKGLLDWITTTHRKPQGPRCPECKGPGPRRKPGRYYPTGSNRKEGSWSYAHAKGGWLWF